MKSVAAFANTDGGTLLIGVDDSGAVLGLENDYASLNADKDKFEVHLRNLLNQQFGAAFVAKKLAISYPSLEGKDICQIEINQASEPLIIKIRDNSGQPVEKFFVRSGNSSQEIPLSQMKSYLQERFQ